MDDTVDLDELAGRDWPDEGVSVKEFTRILGLKSDNSVRKAVKSNRITALPSGRIDPRTAIPEWKSKTLAHQQRAKTPLTDAGDDAAVGIAADNVVPLRPGQAKPTLAEHLARQREKMGLDKADQPAEAAAGSDDSLTTAQLTHGIQLERYRRAKLENDALEGILLAKAPSLLGMEGFAADCREAFQQLADRKAAGLAARLGFEGETQVHRVYVALREVVDEHQTDVLKKIDPSKYFVKLIPGKVPNALR